MRSNNPSRLDDLAAEQVVIGLFLQDENFRSSVVSYILGDNPIETLKSALDAALRHMQGVDSLVPARSALTRILTQEESFFYILWQVAQVLNKVQGIDRDDVNRYLEIYETTMEEAGQFYYVNQSVSNFLFSSALNKLSLFHNNRRNDDWKRCVTDLVEEWMEMPNYASGINARTTKFNSHDTVNILKVLSESDVLNQKRWNRNQREQFMGLIIKLGSVNKISS